MLKKLLNIFKIPDLRTKLLFTVALLCVYRIGFYIPIPGVNAPKLALEQSGGDMSAFGMISNYLSTFTGGDLTGGTIFGLGIMPYISASIIIQLLGTFVPAVEKLRKEGEPGIRKINDWTRYLAVAVCVFQAIMYVWHFGTVDGQKSLYAGTDLTSFMVLAVAMLTAGSVFLMWLGEQIDHFGIGQGVSLIITAGIVSRMPVAVLDVLKACMSQETSTKSGWEFLRYYARDFFTPSGGTKQMAAWMVAFLVVCFIIVVGGSILLTQAQRRIPVQQAKQMRGRRVYGGSKQYLPLRVNHSGVMPIVFASTIVQLPTAGLRALADRYGNNKDWWGETVTVIWQTLAPGTYMNEIVFCIMIFFFAYFWNTVQFQPKEMANQLRDYGSFIPGFRPGKRTADYLEDVMGRITYVGAAFLCAIAVIPSVVSNYMLVGLGPMKSQQISQFLGGTGLLIVISVMLDFVNRIEANLVMRNYGGFLDDDGGAPAKIRRPKGGSGKAAVQPEPATQRDENPRGLPA